MQHATSQKITSRASVVAATLLVGLVALTSVAHARPGFGGGPGHGPGPGPGQPSGEEFRNPCDTDGTASLTTDERARLNALRRTHQGVVETLRNKIDAKQARVEELMARPVHNAATIDGLIDDIAEHSAKLAAARLRFRVDLARIFGSDALDWKQWYRCKCTPQFQAMRK